MRGWTAFSQTMKTMSEEACAPALTTKRSEESDEEKE